MKRHGLKLLAVLASASLFSLSAVNAWAWSWKLGDTPENVLAVFHRGDPGLKPREGASTALPCGIYTDFDAHPQDRYLFFSPFRLSNGKYTPEFQFEFRDSHLKAVLVTAPYSSPSQKPYWTLNDILPENLRNVTPRIIPAGELKEKKGIQLPNDAVLIWDYGDRELQVLVFNLPASPEKTDWGALPVAAYFRAYRNVLLDEGKTIPLPMKNPFMQ
ncbi:MULTISPECIES: hypothetical protein [Leptospirillum]|jgi:hypothetical protein|uniref:Uncharacterized protein n=3 Tax=Leptospirillum ferriphilum TaxID=178606 RepID=A0A059XTU4_9BACT|nr:MULTISPECIES: hypothetical protein [Leptospirillum]EAY56279.1 MAG: protein of unknown function [Leptospirillum rubarum]EIJ76996.1 MAG: hypothetical protein C75L2_00560071 [Leptospirillum sp. Group II 'C75']MCL5259063.1 hypothetical protein [Nitrospirota bacterium]AFS53511.1 hypothetical protein LFML04_1285 [Leptospirillum ferriphilum ML-04]AIA30510.1 hypothetical protein Y981_06235 [Leptospirillum ferriphilum YSK]